MKFFFLFIFTGLWALPAQAVLLGPLLSRVQSQETDPATGLGLRVDVDSVPLGGDFQYWSTFYEVPGGKMRFTNRQFKAWGHLPIIPFLYTGGGLSLNRIVTEGPDATGKVVATQNNIVGYQAVIGSDISFGFKIFAELELNYIPRWSSALFQVGVLF